MSKENEIGWRDLMHELLLIYFFAGVGLFVGLGIINIFRPDMCLIFSPKSVYSDSGETEAVMREKWGWNDFRKTSVEKDSMVCCAVYSYHDNWEEMSDRIEELRRDYPADEYDCYLGMYYKWLAFKVGKYSNVKTRYLFSVFAYTYYFFHHPFLAFFLPVLILWGVFRLVVYITNNSVRRSGQ